MARSNLPDDNQALNLLKSGHQEEAAKRILEDLMGIETGPGRPKDKLQREQTYLDTLQQGIANDPNLTRHGFAPLTEVWQNNGGQQTLKLVSDTNHNRLLDKNDFQIDITNTVLCDDTWGKPLKDRTTKSSDGQNPSGLLVPKLDLTEHTQQQPLLKAGAQEFHLSAQKEVLDSGKVVDWTNWHHNLVLAGKHEFEQLLSNSPELNAKVGNYAPRGRVTLQLDISRQGDVEVRGAKVSDVYGSDDSTKETFKSIAQEAFTRLQSSNLLRFPPGSQRKVNSVEIDVGLRTGNSASWQTDDHERV